MRGVADPFSGGWVARFRDEGDLLRAVKIMKEAGFSEWDAVAPWPCKATELAADACSISRLSIYGVLGAILGGLMMCLWIALTQTNDPSLVVQGRDSGWSSWPALVPAIFESILLGAGLGVAAGFLRSGSLPNWHHWFFETIQEKGKCDREEGFFIVASVECGSGAKKLLEELNPLSMNEVECTHERRKG